VGTDLKRQKTATTSGEGKMVGGPAMAEASYGLLSSLMEVGLQDFASCQAPLLVGFVSLLIGKALRDRFAHFARELVDRGKLGLAAEG
jgi:hypothetical protein